MKSTKSGFTLIELMIVVAIMAILAATSAPRLGDSIRKAKDGRGLAIVGSLRSASMIYYVDNDAEASSDVATIISLIDSKSQLLVDDDSSAITGTAIVAVGFNGDSSGTQDSSRQGYNFGSGNDETEPAIRLGTPDSEDATISIINFEGTSQTSTADTDFDMKGNDWLDY